jgi:hypothetical protein
MKGSLTMGCYLCGATQDLTRDHVPPANLFPEPRPSNLITVPCCKACNQSYSLDDEAMRVWLAAAENRSTSGESIWREKVVSRTFYRSPALRASFARSLVPVLAERHGIQFPAIAITIPDVRADRYFVRIVKGLLTHFYPGFDHSTHSFEVDHISPKLDDIAMLRSRFSYEERGHGVFRFYHGVVSDPPTGFWLLVFYDWACFMVVHQPNSEGL